MHEYSMTTMIVEAVLEEARRHGAEKVLEVELAIGEFTFLNPEQVEFWYKVLSERESLLKGSKLKIEMRKGSVRCLNCGYEGNITLLDDPAYHVIVPTLLCPECGGTVKIVSGRECTIKRIKLLGR
ncbi:hydrogenase maturation nickel metallochaperone HypA [Candidatus Bathyarchaeota archaeon]|nr:MAG: hydrogenase maturation nickel metallochaperone HypA [Candidatus Bathyarchaeota archaeon]RLG98062.1 MAG: hydrogenase maturation nickel metallochaperone HypA [Candidatus Bathyarchaeota archaeon]